MIRWTIDLDAETDELLIVDHGQGIVVARTGRIAERFVRILVDAANQSQIGSGTDSTQAKHVDERAGALALKSFDSTSSEP